ncbi:16S rRNA (guanine(966)-N(2))-methyltransferase RsmD [Methylocystis heyeri]|uniref:16S rRNA (Guanine(966)-N(2))-methyltransferase RsmD n=1 Tax=Methylocystis heyeri TaxID=391905 RepID=A0A6B8KHS0_9HYPH|nr:16S rRNA (guanine(966)-N(2))-methyltransferase RsmD [Methylocystis heyeri]QGM47182.1 16S rRNA (guanine(966)-N(2))-methyltransferase RsmD [Methylocystis heyeri]
MRIVGGALRGRALAGPKTQNVRPTSDRLRESIFDILAHAYDDPARDAAVIDVFAGTGALGFEALSRGAARAMFVDSGAEARALLRENIEKLGLGGVTRVFRRDAAKLGAAPAGEVFSLAFLDPPYGKGLAPLALAELLGGGWLAPGAIVVIEESAGVAVDLPPGILQDENRRYGDTQIVFARKEA